MSQLSKYLMNKTLVGLNEDHGVVFYFEDPLIVLAVYNPLSVEKDSKIISCDVLKALLPIHTNNILESHARAVLHLDHGITIDIDLLTTSNSGPEAMVLRIGRESFVVW